MGRLWPSNYTPPPIEKKKEIEKAITNYEQSPREQKYLRHVIEMLKWTRNVATLGEKTKPREEEDNGETDIEVIELHRENNNT